MIYPSREDFMRLADKADLIPVHKVILADLETPVSAFMKLSERPYSYLLESVEGGSRIGRYSFLGFAPEKVVRIQGRTIVSIDDNGQEESFEDDHPFERLLSMTQSYRLPEGSVTPPFCGGAVGYLSYDVVRHFENIPDSNDDPAGLPDAIFMFTHRYLIFDRVTNCLRIVANAVVNGSPEKAYDQAVRDIEETVEDLSKAPPIHDYSFSSASDELDFISFTSQDDFQSSVLRCLDYIRKGHILQAVLSMRFSVKIKQDPFTIYRALRLLNPSPYTFYLKMGDVHLVGSSPETMVKVENDKVTMNPIAGTRPRGRSLAEDQILEKELLNDGKEAAEHLMLVDLARNDLGRICLPGTISVSSFRHVERFSHVMHLVSTVEGDLVRPGDPSEVIRSVFPAGTVSGAPKIRAMEIIDELEGLKRGPYAGLVGYFDYRGNMDSCITIRTIVIKDDQAFIQAGAGIVADSRPEKEYLECRHKAEALFRAIKLAHGGEL